MDRRHFIRLSMVAGGAGIVAPVGALAATSTGAGGLYYTMDAPGRWSKKVAGHVPVIEVSGTEIKVTTPHEMKGHEHYIVKHIVLDEQFGFIDEKMFDPATDPAPISQFSLPNARGRIHVLSVCNKHDTWLNFADL